MVLGKCPFSKTGMTIKETANVNDPNSMLKRNHAYYFQVQGTMASCNVEWAGFLVYTTKEVYCERIYFDSELWNKTMLPKLTSFYFSYIYGQLYNKD